MKLSSALAFEVCSVSFVVGRAAQHSCSPLKTIVRPVRKHENEHVSAPFGFSRLTKIAIMIILADRLAVDVLEELVGLVCQLNAAACGGRGTSAATLKSGGRIYAREAVEVAIADVGHVENRQGAWHEPATDGKEVTAARFAARRATATMQSC